MADDLKEILDAADQLGQLVAKHPAVAKFKAAQKSLSEDPEAGRLMTDFTKKLEVLSRQEASGIGVSDAQRQELEKMQLTISSNLKVKALNIAEVDMTDVLRKVSQAWQKHLADSGSRAVRS